MSDAVDKLEDEDRSWPDLGILPQSLAQPPSDETEGVGTHEATPAAAAGAPPAEPARKEWLLIRLGHRLCGFRG